jgi:hypothetical protein
VKKDKKEFPVINFEYMYNNIGISKFSFSSLTLYDACPYCYYLNYVCGVKQKWVSDNLLLGSIVHKILENEEITEDKFKIEKLINETINYELRDRYLKGSTLPELKEDVYKMVQLIKDYPMIRANGDPVKLKQREAEAYIPIGKFVLHSKIDGITDRNEIVEHKTSSIKYTIDTVHESYQHVLYEMVFRHTVGISSNGVIYDILYKGSNPIREQIKVDVSENEIAEAKAWMNNIVEHIQDKIWKPYKPVDRKHKGWCDYKNLCRWCSGEEKNHVR